MSLPIFTATAGPVDQNAGARAKIYASLSGLLGLVPVLTVFGVINGDQGTAIGNFVQAGIGLAGAFGLAFAAKKTSTQAKNGTFEAAPELPAVSALEQLKILRDQAAHEVDTNVAAAQTGADALQARATELAKTLGVPSIVRDVSNAGFDAVQELIRKTAAGHQPQL